MSVTEIYSCVKGQPLKEGKLDFAHDIWSKEEAEADAKRRVQADPSLERIAYYQVSESGKFRIFYTFMNQNVRAAPKKRRAAGGGGGDFMVGGKKKTKGGKPSLTSKVLRALGLGK